MTVERAGGLSREAFYGLLTRHLTRLYRFVHDRIRSYEAAGELMPNELAMEDVVDEVLLRAYRDYVRDPHRRPTGRGLLRLARERLEAERRRLQAERRRGLPIEEDIPEGSRLDRETQLGEQILYYFQPDEDLRREDILPDPKAPPPDQVEDRDELRRCLSAALAALPREWRRALELRFLDGADAPKLASELGKPESEAEHIVEHARAFLRQRLVESGCVLEGARG